MEHEEYDIKSDQFSEDEQKKIVKMILADVDIAKESMADWKEMRKKDLQQINGEAPSKIENLNKRKWQSDRNLGLMLGILDIYQATLYSTCYNPDSIHFVATEKNDVDNKDNLEKFSKWALGAQEVDFAPEADDFINNRVGQGFSVFKIGWEVKDQWIDKRIPRQSKENPKLIIRYDKKTELKRIERGTIRNIDELDDILIPSYGKHIQELPFFIERLHMYWKDLEDASEKKIAKNVTEKLKNALKTKMCMDRNKLRKKDSEALGIQDIADEELRSYPVDIYEWYGEYEKAGKMERYRFWIEPESETFLSGKPLRKIRRDGKYPYAGGALRRRPGHLRGGSLTSLVSPAINALNNVYNQKSDYQTIQNCPFGFRRTSEGFSEAVMDLEPGKLFDHDGNPADDIFFPNLSRSLAWADNDINFLLQIIERLTGAASYFLTSDSKDSTATRDAIVNEKGETKFGLWVKRIQIDIAEAINMMVINYQDWAPPKLGERILGEDGKQLIRNMSVNSLIGSFDVRMVPDILSGSKVFERQMKMWGLQLAANSVWFMPEINPRGNYKLTADAMKVNGYQNPESYMPPQPKSNPGDSDEIKEEWQRFMQGERFSPPEGETPLVMEHWAGHNQQKEEKYHELDEEYRANFDAHLFETFMNMMNFIKKQQQEMLANQIAMRATQGVQGYVNPQPPAPPSSGAQPLRGMPIGDLPGATNGMMQ